MGLLSQTAAESLSANPGLEEQPRSPSTFLGLQGLEGLETITAQPKTVPSQMFNDLIHVIQGISYCPKIFFSAYRQRKNDPALSCKGTTQCFDGLCSILS